MDLKNLKFYDHVQDNAVLCNEVNEKVVQHFVHCIESFGKHVQVSIPISALLLPFNILVDEI